MKPLRSRRPMPDENRAKLEAMREDVVERLMGDGITTAWLAERSGVPQHHAASWVTELGARRDGNRYRLPNLARSRGQNAPQGRK